MKTTSCYQWDHMLAKLIIYLTYLLVGVVSIETNNPYFTLVIGTPIWLFGVNAAGYLVECIGGHPHYHSKL